MKCKLSLISYNRSEKSSDLMDGSDFTKARLKMELKSISEMVVSTITALVTMARLSKSFFILRVTRRPFPTSHPGQFALFELPEEAWKRVRIFPTSLQLTSHPKSPRTTGNEAGFLGHQYGTRDVM